MHMKRFSSPNLFELMPFLGDTSDVKKAYNGRVIVVAKQRSVFPFGVFHVLRQNNS
jgi:hypothetical protein